MTGFDIGRRRLANQRLIGAPLKSAADVVRWLGAVQSQDYPGAKWGVAQRMRGATDAALDRDFNEGLIVRTHALRPTWHFLAPEDLRWVQALTGPRVHAANGFSYRSLELDPKLLVKSHGVIAKALEGGRHLTRRELGAALTRRRIDTAGQRLAYIVMYAELEALVCSGPLRGKQFTYALVDERVPPSKPLPRDEALAMLTLRYFTSHGPALAKDFAWWSGLTARDVKEAIALAGRQLAADVFDGKTYYTAARSRRASVPSPLVHLLPNFDEHVVAYRDHGPSIEDRVRAKGVANRGVLLAHLVAIDGAVAGGWRRSLRPGRVGVDVAMLRRLSSEERAALQRAAAAYGTFLGVPAVLSVQ